MIKLISEKEAREKRKERHELKKIKFIDEFNKDISSESVIFRCPSSMVDYLGKDFMTQLENLGYKVCVTVDGRIRIEGDESE